MSEEDQNDQEEYKQQALLFKDQGNEAFQAGNVDLAIQYFTQAISIDPDNHIVYSNRSAAYMKINHISKALHDAEICVELAPNWSKGYNRLGTAQQGLKRFEAAIQSFKKGIELDPNNPALWSCLKLCEKAYEKDKEERFKKAELERQLEEERLKRREDAKNQILKNSKKNDEENLLDDFFDDIGTSSKSSEKKHHEPHIQDAKADEEDNLLASFFSDVTNSNSTSKEAPKKTESDIIESFDNKEGGEEEEKTILTEKYVKQPLGSSQEVVDRLLCPFHEWKNLNPYHVFSLDIDATDEDIKFRYKKLSLKVHPDRCRGIENAREAFELVKAAYEKLMDEDQRKIVIAHIENVTNEVNKGRKKIIKEKGISEEDLPDYEQERQRKIMKHFADLEQMRRVSEKNKRVYSAREKEQENEEVEKAQKFEEFEKEWSEENRREHRVGNWRDFQHAPPSKKLKATNYKEESREEKKFGQVQLESWKKSWK